MKKLYFLSVLLLMSITAYSQETVKREFSVSSGKLFSLKSAIGGSIIVKGSAQSTVNVSITHNGGNDFKFNFSESAQGITLNASGTNKWQKNKKVKYEITVPQNFDLDLNTSGGNINVNTVEGKLSGKTSGGNIVLVKTKGTISMKTSGGNIAFAETSGSGLAHTSGGNISMAGLNGKFDLKTSGGNINLSSSKIEGEINTSGGNITCKSTSVNGSVKTSGGNINVDKAPEGISVATSGGNIDINAAKSFAVAKTSGGNITLSEVDGWITANTSGGNITAKMVGSSENGKRDVELKSSGGTLTLTVPGGMGMNIEIETTYNKKYTSKKPKIISDFAIEQSENADGNTVRMYGKGKVGNGKHTIRLKTSGGSVYLKKG